MCDPHVCNTVAANVKAVMHLSHAFDWKTQFGLELCPNRTILAPALSFEPALLWVYRAHFAVIADLNSN